MGEKKNEFLYFVKYIEYFAYNRTIQISAILLMIQKNTWNKSLIFLETIQFEIINFL